MKTVMLIILSLGLLTANAAPSYEGSHFSDVWGQVTSDEYDLPNNKISLSSLGGWAADKLKNSVNRTLSDRSDILPQFRKLAHPNGICLSGSWRIYNDSPYSGYFKRGSEGLIIARASSALSNTKVGNYRSFGLAGKIFPTVNPQHSQALQTANFFLIDDFGGSKAEHFTDVNLVNEPPASTTSAVVKNLAYVLKLASVFSKGDSNPSIRQLYEISELGEQDISQIKTPKWMKVRAANGQAFDAEDFRDELNISQRGEELKFYIYVASEEYSEGKKDWKQIGEIQFTDSVVSNSCDHRLHFHHPRWRDDLNH